MQRILKTKTKNRQHEYVEQKSGWRRNPTDKTKQQEAIHVRADNVVKGAIKIKMKSN